MFKNIRQFLKETLTSPIASNTAILSFGRLTAAALGFVTSIIVARLLKPAEFGLLSVVLAIFAIAVVIAGMGLGTSLIRFVPLYSLKEPEKANYYLKVGFGLLSSFVLVIALIGMLSSGFIAQRIYYKPQMTRLIQLGFIAVISGILWNYLLVNLHSREMFRAYAGFSISVSLLKLAGIGLLFWTALFSVKHVLLVYIIVPAIGFAAGMLFVPSKFLGVKGNFREAVSELLHFAKWIFVIDVSIMIFSRIDILILGRYAEEQVVGFYSAAYNIVYPMTIITSSFVSVLLPQVAKFKTTQEIRQYIRKIPKITVLGALLLLPIFLFIKPLVNLLLGMEYLPAADLFRILFWGILFNFLIEPLYLISYSVNRPQILSMVCIIKVGLSLTANILLIPRYGAEGAAYASVITHVIGGCIALGMVYRYAYKPAPVLLAKSSG